MTPMSDVMVLLLTFFMLTSTFVKNEPVKVNTPGSVSEIKVPENNVLSILVDKQGKIFLNMDKPGDMQTILESMCDQYGITLTAKQIETARKSNGIGVSMNDIQELLSQSEAKVNDYQKDKGIPTDSIDGKMSEFQLWVKAVRDNLADGSDTKIAIKADENTTYKVVKKLMSELQDMNENRYFLITSYKKVED